MKIKLCPRCKTQLKPSDLPEYKFLCEICDENFYNFEAITAEIPKIRKTKNFRGIVNNVHPVESDTFIGLKTIASRTANNTNNAVDFLTVTHIHGEPTENIQLVRINQKTPWGSITRGKWR